MEDTYYFGVTVKGIKDREAMRDAALRRAVEMAPFSAPEEEVEAEYQRLLAEFRHRRIYESMSACRPLYGYEGLEEQMEKLRGEAAFQVGAQLVLADIIRREGLTVSEEEVEAEGKAIAQRQEIPLEQVKDFLGPDMAMVRADLLERKAMDFIVEHAVIS